MASSSGDNKDNKRIAELIEQLSGEVPRIDAAIKNYMSLILAQQQTAEDEVEKPLTPQDAIACARIIVSLINKHVWLDPVQWGAAHPQPEEQSGMDRVDDIAVYRVARELANAAKNQEKSVTKMVGKTPLRLVLPDLREQALANAGTRRHEMETFIDGLLKSTNEDDEESTLIWASDFQGVLAARHKQRKSDAEERIARAEDNEEFVKQLKSAIAS